MHDKLSTTFHKKRFVVIEKHGNIVVVDNAGVQYKRNVSHVKQFNADNDAIDCDNVETPETQTSVELTFANKVILFGTCKQRNVTGLVGLPYVPF